MAATNKVREELAQAFLAALKEDRIPWRACWTQGRPYNAVSGRRYKGVNTLRLSMLADEQGYTDPRWCTFQQAKEKGWKIRKGEHATKVEYWAMYDAEEKKLLSWDEVKRMMRDDPDAADKLQLRSYISLVFNVSQIEGIPALQQRQTTDIGDLRRQRDTLLENMHLAYREEGTRAYYSPMADMVTLPPEGSFDDPYSYISTFLHECGHATGHPSRLNRHIENHFGSEDYAREELRAEIASAFVSQELRLEMSQKAMDEHFDLHKAYIQSWIETLEKDPQELFVAIKDANSIANYMMEKGEFLQGQELAKEKRQIQQPKRQGTKYIPADLIELARSQDVFDILQRTGEPLVKKDGQWRSVAHDSLVVTPGKGYYWFSRAEGSKSPIDYFVHVHGMSFQQAAKTVLDAINRDIAYAKQPVQEQQRPVKNPRFRPLPRAKSNLDAYNYLTQERGLDAQLVRGLMEKGIIYQTDKYKNVTFVGTDFDGVVVSQFARCYDEDSGTSKFRRFDAWGSSKAYRFRIENPTCPRCNVFESEIDLLSYLSLRPETERTENYISLGGVSPKALYTYLQHRPDTTQINICTDNDKAGEKFAKAMQMRLGDEYEVSREAASIGKDWNESLVRLRDLKENWEHETNDPDTEEWRDRLTPQEAKLVAAWDDGFDDGLAHMAADTLARSPRPTEHAQDDLSLNGALAKLNPAKQEHDPFARKDEDWTY